MSTLFTHSFIRTLWGDNKAGSRRRKIENDIKAVKQNIYPFDGAKQPEFICYTYGEDNHKQLIDMGINSKLISSEPRMFIEKEEYAHKLYSFKEATKDFRSIIFLDWDVLAVKPIPEDMWDKMSTYAIKVMLRIYHNRKVTWRKKDQRKVPCASWVYINNPTVAEELFETWEELKRPWREELALGRYCDYITEGFNLKRYEEMIEPEYFHLDSGAVFEHPNACFKHFNKSQISRLLKGKGL